MKDLIWKDATSYSKNDSERIPRVWETMAGASKITVHRHIFYKDTWLITCRNLGIEHRDLKTDDLKEAKTRAIEIVVDRALEIVLEMEKIIDALGGQEG